MSELLGKTKLGVSLYLIHDPWYFMSPSDHGFYQVKKYDLIASDKTEDFNKLEIRLSQSHLDSFKAHLYYIELEERNAAGALVHIQLISQGNLFTGLCCQTYELLSSGVRVS